MKPFKPDIVSDVRESDPLRATGIGSLMLLFGPFAAIAWYMRLTG